MFRQSHIIAVVALLMSGHVPSWGKPVSDAKLAKNFTVKWASVNYSKNMQIQNPEIGSGQPQDSERLSISLQIEIRDPKLILGLSQQPAVTEMLDDSGRPIVIPASPRRFRSGYRGLRYSPTHKPQSGPSTWVAKARSYLGGRTARSGPPQLVMALQPSRMDIQFDVDVLADDANAIGRIKGSFDALVAESFEYVDVPFEPNESWVQLTPDMEIRVRHAECTGSSYEYHIETYPPGGRAGPFRSVGDPLPKRVVVSQDFLDSEGNSEHQGMPHRTLHVPLGGHGSGSGRNVQIAKIRYTIAVNPAHRKVPFEVKDIPLPKP